MSRNDDLDQAIKQAAASRQKEIDEKKKQLMLKATNFIVDDINAQANCDNQTLYKGRMNSSLFYLGITSYLLVIHP